MKKQFTLIEVLVVVAIIGILASMLLPVLGDARKKSREALCKNNLKQIGIANSIYADNWEGYYVPSTTNTISGGVRWEKNTEFREYVGWDRDGLADYMAPQSLMCPDRVDELSSLGVDYDSSKKAAKVQRVYYCPRITGSNAYRGLNMSWINDNSNLINVGPVDNALGIWHASVAERHNGKSNLLYFDGHVAPQTYTYLISKGETDSPWADEGRSYTNMNDEGAPY